MVQIYQCKFILSYLINITFKMQTQADPALLSLLQKIANPLQNVELTIFNKGVFAPPEQWKLTDEANPNIFTYTLQTLHSFFSAGKIEPRKLTDKQIKEQEQAKAKKGSKKQSKQQQKPIEIDPLAQKKRLEWQSLSQSERFYRTQEDPYKAFSLRWPDNKKSENLNREHLNEFEAHIATGQLEITLTRKPEMNEEEIGKLKKSKPKNLNIGELYAAKYRGYINLQQLNHPGAVRIEQRVNLSFVGEVPADGIKIEADKCYVLVQIVLGQSLNPLVEQVRPKAEQLLGEKQEKVLKKSLMIRLCDQIQKGAHAISQQYSSFFSKQKDHSDDKKFTMSGNTNFLNVSTLRINQINKRKELFLADFVSSGKYELLRERIVATVRAIIVDKCRKERQSMTVTRQSLQRTLSELNVFFRETLEKTLDACIINEASVLHEDIVLNYDMSRSARKQAVGGISESNEQRQLRLANEYETINRLDQAEQKYLNLVLIHDKDIIALQNYARFCLRNGKFDHAFALYSRINEQSNQFRHKLILDIFKVHRNRDREAIIQLSELQKKDGVSIDQKITIYLLLSFVHERLGQEKRSEKYLALAEKYHQMKYNPNLKINPSVNPYVQPVPRVPKPGKFVSSLSQQESQQIRLALISYLVEYSFYGLAKSYLPKIAQSDKRNQIEALILYSEGSYEEAITLVQGLIEKDKKNMDLLLLKAEICFKSERMFECEEVFLYILKLKPSAAQAYSIYLRLALTYLNRKSYEDAKITFNKALEITNNSSVGWLGLGIANLQLGLIKQSEEAFNLSSIYNPLSSQSTSYLQEISKAVDKQNQANYKYFQVKE